MPVTNRDILLRRIISIYITPMEEVSEFKYLGLQLDLNSKYNSQVKHMCGRLSRLCGMTYRLTSVINLKSAKQVYFSCAYAVARYCICNLGGALRFGYSTNQLCRLHKKWDDNLFSKFVPQSCCIFKVVGIFKLSDILKYNIGMYMVKILKLQSCPTLQDNLRLEYPNRHYKT